MFKQILLIQGGNVFNSYEEYLQELKNKNLTMEKLLNINWKKTLSDDLGGVYDIIQPAMPCRDNAKYVEWKIWFDKVLPLLNDELILIGSSLGAVFLAKYLSENEVNKKIIATFLVAAPFKLETKYALADFKITGGLEKLESQAGKLFFYQSKDEEIVQYSEVEEYRERLPNVNIKILDGYGHFNVAKFPEIIEDIKAIS